MSGHWPFDESEPRRGGKRWPHAGRNHHRKKPGLIEELAALAKRHQAPGAVLFLFDPEGGQVRMITWGKNRSLCSAMGSIGNQFHEQLERGEVGP